MNKVPHILKLLRDYEDNKKDYQRMFAKNDWNVTVPQVGVLRTLARYDYMTVTEIAEAIGIHITTADGYTKRLSAKGMITVEVNPKDRRSRILRITQKGLDAISNVPLGYKSLLVYNLNKYAPQQDIDDIEKGLILLMKYISFIE